MRRKSLDEHTRMLDRLHDEVLRIVDATEAVYTSVIDEMDIIEVSMAEAEAAGNEDLADRLQQLEIRGADLLDILINAPRG